MIILDIFFNLTILVTVSVIAGFVDNRWKRTTLTGVVLQGLLFGGVAMLAMLKTYALSPGIIFDGRSVVLSLGALFFGPVTGIIAVIIAVITRLMIGGTGTLMGVSVILSSVVIGLFFYQYRKKRPFRLNTLNLLMFGLLIHVIMVLLMIALPSSMHFETFETVAATIILVYPLATIIIGKILSDQENRSQLLVDLQTSEQKFRGLIESAFDGIYLMENRNYTFVNPSFAKLTGYSQEELTAPGFNFNQLLTENSSGSVEQRYQARKNGEAVPPQYETQIKTHSGSIKDVEVSTVPHTSKDKLMVLGIMRDVTDRKHAEELIRMKNQELGQLNEEKDKLFSIIAHDLRGPLGAIIGLLEMMADEEDPMEAGELRHISKNMLKSTKLLYSMLENLLDWSRIKRGIIAMNVKEFDLQTLINHCVFEMQELASRKEIVIDNLVRDKLLFPVDENMFYSVFINLLSNAIKFTRRGGQVRVSAAQKRLDCLEFSVSDTGIGMDEDTMQHLFSLNSRTSTPGTEGEPSTGLGLVICKEFVEKHGGEIYAESQLGIGSTFAFTLSSQEVLG
ncbi:MAG: PAS domain S-box protein [Bacteroidales bacterium]|nr:PAS domain S-box protein [Bacteroidales bacterium]MDZ4203825.1 PAS domain S-box protein [Bacteroidales bacterium]